MQDFLRDERESQRKRVMTFLHTFKFVATGFGVSYLLIGGLLHNNAALFCGVTVFLLVFATHIGEKIAISGKYIISVILFYIAIMTTCILFSIFYPDVYPVLLLLPPLATVFALPYVSYKAAYKLMSGAMITGFIIVISGTNSPFITPPPMWFTKTIIITGGIAGVSLLIFLFQQLRDSLLESAQRRAKAESRIQEAAFMGGLIDSLTHDLKSPVATLAGLTDGLHQESDPERIHHIKNTIQKLQLRIYSLVDTAKRNTWKDIEVDEINLHHTIQNHMEYLLTIINSRDNHFQLIYNNRSAIPYILAKTEEIIRIIENIITNSIGEHASQITITITEDTSNITIIFHDDGPGYPMAIIEQGIQVGFSNRKGGSGLGLVGVKANVEAFGGIIEFMNDSGAKTIIRFPRSR